MNLVAGRIEGDAVVIGTWRIPLDRQRRPHALQDRRVVVGIRPETFEDVAFAEAGLPQYNVQVEVVEELGSDAFLFFEIDATPVVVEEAVSAKHEDAATLFAQDRDRALFGARVDPRTSARPGSAARVALDPSRLYFFSPDTGDSLLPPSGARAA